MLRDFDLGLEERFLILKMELRDVCFFDGIKVNGVDARSVR